MSSLAESLPAMFEPGGRLENLGILELGFCLRERKIWEHIKRGEDDEADETAELLLLEPNLPMVLRARANIALSTRDDGFSVLRATEALRIMQVDVRNLFKGENEQKYPESMLRTAQRALVMAQRLVEERRERLAHES